jgi:NitT/TauT family transport system substrate-binding protein
MPSRQHWLACLALLLLTACVPAQNQQVGQSPTPEQRPAEPAPPLGLSIGWGVTPITASPAAVLWLADDLGFYAREGLKPDLMLIQGTPNLIAGMRSGQVDVAVLTAYEAVLLTATKSIDLRMIGGSGASGQANTFMVVSRDSVGSLDELRGKSLAVARIGSYDDTLAKQFLRARGLDPSEIQFLALGDPNVRLQALIARQIDATLTSISTWVNIRQQPGIKILASFDEVNKAVPSWPSGQVVTAQIARDRAEQLRRYTRAVVKASRFFATNKQAWVDAMAKRRTDMDPADLAELWDLFQHGWSVNGGMNLTDYEKGADLLYSTSPDFAQVPRIGLSEWADSQFVDAALREVGVDASMDAPGRAP